jgi:LytS/YehU family sensor histidine kinase
MVRANDINAEKFIINLSEVYRQLLKKQDFATIPLSEEVEFLTSYVFMLHARFETTLQVQIAILPESTQKQIPAFSLQLLVENCIKHNIISSARPLHINIYQNGLGSVTVENNLQIKPSYAEEPSGIGLGNLKKRYELLNVESGVTVQATDSKFIVSLKLL